MKYSHHSYARPISHGFTLVEILVVIAIIAVLASLVYSIAGKMMLKAEKVACTALMRDVSLSLISYEADFNKLPLPKHKDEWDTILGDPGGPRLADGHGKLGVG